MREHRFFAGGAAPGGLGRTGGLLCRYAPRRRQAEGRRKRRGKGVLLDALFQRFFQDFFYFIFCNASFVHILPLIRVRQVRPADTGCV